MIKPRRPPTEETTLAEARRIANYLLRLLPDDVQADYVAKAHAGGIRWLGAEVIVYEDDRQVPTRVAAEIAGVVPETILRWTRTPDPRDHTRPLLSPVRRRPGHPNEYLVSAVRAATVIALTHELPRVARFPSSPRVAA